MTIFRSKILGFKKESHSSEMQDDALMHPWLEFKGLWLRRGISVGAASPDAAPTPIRRRAGIRGRPSGYRLAGVHAVHGKTGGRRSIN